jgi:hypothetical protein
LIRRIAFKGNSVSAQVKRCKEQVSHLCVSRNYQ